MTENKMEQYCKLPIPITAYQTDKEMYIETLEGTHHASVGDWIITGVNGEQYPCKPDIFAKTYIKYGQATKMEQVATMFGKKLNEVFRAQNTRGDNREVMFCEEGVMVRPGICHSWFRSTEWLNDLLTGKVMIVDD